jgi:hypothetical protein
LNMTRMKDLVKSTVRRTAAEHDDTMRVKK